MAEHIKDSTYYAVFATLGVLTVLTVVLAGVDLSHAGNIVVGALIAVVKASLVGLFFMHLRYEKDRWIFLAAFFPLLLFTIICFAMMPDVGFPPRG